MVVLVGVIEHLCSMRVFLECKEGGRRKKSAFLEFLTFAFSAGGDSRKEDGGSQCFFAPFFFHFFFFFLLAICSKLLLNSTIVFLFYAKYTRSIHRYIHMHLCV